MISQQMNFLNAFKIVNVAVKRCIPVPFRKSKQDNLFHLFYLTLIKSENLDTERQHSTSGPGSYFKKTIKYFPSQIYKTFIHLNFSNSVILSV